MEELTLEHLLLQFQIPDNVILTEAEAELSRRTNESPDGLLLDLLLLFENTVDVGVRKLASILLTKRIKDKWPSMAYSDQLERRQQLLMILFSPSLDDDQRSDILRVVIAIFKFHLVDDKWPALTEAALTCLGAEDEGPLALGVTVLSEILAVCGDDAPAPDELLAAMPTIVDTLRTIVLTQPPESVVFTAAVKSVENICSHIDEHTVKDFQEIVLALNNHIPNLNEDSLLKCLESFGVVFAQPWWRIDGVFGDLLGTMCNVALEATDSTISNVAWSVVGIAVHFHIKAIAKMDSVSHLISLLCHGVVSHCQNVLEEQNSSRSSDRDGVDGGFGPQSSRAMMDAGVTRELRRRKINHFSNSNSSADESEFHERNGADDEEYEDDDEDDDDGRGSESENVDDPFAFQIFKILYARAPVELFFRQLLDEVPAWQANAENLYLRIAANDVIALGVRSIQRAIRASSELMTTIIEIAQRGLGDEEDRVREAACLLVAQIAAHCQPQAQAYSELVVTALLETLRSENSATQESACVALDEFLKGMDSAGVAPFLEDIMGCLTPLVSTTSHEAVLSCLASVAGAAGKDFQDYLEGVVTHLASLVTDVDAENFTLSCQAMDTIGGIVKSLPASVVECHLDGFVQASLQVIEHIDEPEVKISAFQMYQDFSSVVGEEFSALLPAILPVVFRSARISDIEHFGEGDGRVSFKEHVLEGDNVDEHGHYHAGTMSPLASKTRDGRPRSIVDDDESALLESYAPSDDEEGLSNVAIDGLYEVSHALDLLAELLTNCPKGMCSVVDEVIALCAEIECSRKFRISYVRGACMNTSCALTAVYMQMAGIDEWEAGLPLQHEGIHEDILNALNKCAFKVLTYISREKSLTQATDTMHFFKRMLEVAGPYLVSDDATLSMLVSLLPMIVRQEIRCQVLAERTKLATDEDDTPELQFAMVEQGLDTIAALAQALGHSFAPFAEDLLHALVGVIVEKQSTGEPAPVFQRATVVGNIAQIAEAMGTELSPLSNECLEFVIPFLQDEDDEVHGNALHAAGVLLLNGDVSLLTHASDVLEHLQNVLGVHDFTIPGLGHILDNAVGCYGRTLKRVIATTPRREATIQLLATLASLAPSAVSAMVALLGEGEEPDELVCATDQVLALVKQCREVVDIPLDGLFDQLRILADGLDECIPAFEEPGDFERVLLDLKSFLSRQ